MKSADPKMRFIDLRLYNHELEKKSEDLFNLFKTHGLIDAVHEAARYFVANNRDAAGELHLINLTSFLFSFFFCFVFCFHFFFFFFVVMFDGLWMLSVALVRFDKAYPSTGRSATRIFVNQYPAGILSGMVEHEDTTSHASIILMLGNPDDSPATALQLGRSGNSHSVFMNQGDILVFYCIRHQLPICKRKASRLTLNFFF